MHHTFPDKTLVVEISCVVGGVEKLSHFEVLIGPGDEGAYNISDLVSYQIS